MQIRNIKIPFCEFKTVEKAKYTLFSTQIRYKHKLFQTSFTYNYNYRSLRFIAPAIPKGNRNYHFNLKLPIDRNNQKNIMNFGICA